MKVPELDSVDASDAEALAQLRLPAVEEVPVEAAELDADAAALGQMRGGPPPPPSFESPEPPPEEDEFAVDAQALAGMRETRERENALLKRFFEESEKGTPERRAAIAQLARETGASIEYVTKNYGELYDAIRYAGWDSEKFREKYPPLAKGMLEDPQAASLVVGNPETNILLEGLKKVRSLWNAASQKGAELERLNAAIDVASGNPLMGLDADSPEEMAERTGPSAAALANPQEAVANARAEFAAPLPEEAAPPTQILRKVGTGQEGALEQARIVTTARWRQGQAQTEHSRTSFDLMLARRLGRDTAELEGRLDTLDKEMREIQSGAGPVVRVLGEAVGQAPGQGQTLLGYGVGGAAAVAAGVATAAATRSPAAGRRVTRSLFNVFGKAGAFVLSAEQITGAAYASFVKMKTDDGAPMDEEVAAGAAIVTGLMGAGVETSLLDNFMAMGINVGGGIRQAFTRGGAPAAMAEALKQPAAREVLKRLARGAAGESFEEFAQGMLESGFGYYAKSRTAGIAQGGAWQSQKADFAGAVTENLANAVGVIPSTLAHGAAGRAVSLAAAPLAAANFKRASSQKGEAQLNAIVDVLGTHSAQAAPEFLAKMIAEQTERDGARVESIFVDPKEFTRFNQMANRDAALEAEALLGPQGRAILEAAVASGDKLELPLSAVISTWKGREDLKDLLPHLTVRYGHLTPAELARQGTDEEIQKGVETLIGQIEAGELPPAGPWEAAFVAGRRRDLRAAGYSKKQIETYVAENRAVLLNMAARANKTPEEAFRNMAFQVGRVGSEALRRKPTFGTPEAAPAVNESAAPQVSREPGEDDVEPGEAQAEAPRSREPGEDDGDDDVLAGAPFADPEDDFDFPLPAEDEERVVALVEQENRTEPLPTVAAVAEARAMAARMRPDNRAEAEAWIAYAAGETATRPIVSPVMEKRIAALGVVDPEGFHYDPYTGRDLSPVGKTRKRSAGQEEPAELRAHRLARNLSVVEASELPRSYFYQRLGVAPPPGPLWYSAVEEAALTAKQAKGNAASWKAVLSKTPGVKREELDLLGIDDWLDKQEGSITREQVAEFVRANQLQVEETILGEPRPLTAEDRERVTQEAITQVLASRTLARHGIEWLASDPARRYVRFVAGVMHDEPDAIARSLEKEGVSADDITAAREAMEALENRGPARIEKQRVLERTQALEILEGQGVTTDVKPWDQANTRNEYAWRDARDPAAILEALKADGLKGAALDAVQRAFETLEVDPSIDAYIAEVQAKQTPSTPRTQYRDYQLPGGKQETYRELLVRVPQAADFYAPHFNSENRGLLAHARFAEHTLASGERVMLIEEVQSDLHQQGREKGYADPGAEKKAKEAHDRVVDAHDALRHLLIDERDFSPSFVGDLIRFKPEEYAEKLDPAEYAVAQEPEVAALLERYRAARRERAEAAERSRGVPDAPHKETWEALVLRRLVRYAAEKGYSKIAWTTGSTQGERYGLAKQIDKLTLTAYRAHNQARMGEGKQRLQGYKDGKVVVDEAVTPEELPGVVGKEIAAKLLEASPPPFEVMPYLEWVERHGNPRDREFAASAPEAWVPVNPADPRDPHPAKRTRAEAEEEARALSVAAPRELAVTAELGGEGMRVAYDKRIPGDVAKIIKKFGGKVQRERLAGEAQRAAVVQVEGRFYVERVQGEDTDDIGPYETREEAEADAESLSAPPTPGPEVWTADIPEALRQTAVQKGMVLFQSKKKRHPADKGPEARNLLVHHNISPTGLRHALGLDALVVPSIAVSRVEHPMQQFGEITLLAPPQMVDPKTGTPIFDADIYSPRQPRAEYKPDAKAVKRLGEWLYPYVTRLGGTAYGIESAVKNRGDEGVLHDSDLQAGLALAFLEEVAGIKPELPRRPARLASDDPAFATVALQTFFEKSGAPQFNFGDRYHLALSEAVRAAIEELIADKGLEGDAAKRRRDNLTKRYFGETEGDPLLFGKADAFARAWLEMGKEVTGVDKYAARDLLASLLGERTEEFHAWSREKTKGLVAGRVLQDGYDRLGRPRYRPYTPENIRRMMTRAIRQGESDSGSMHHTRAAGAKRFRSLAGIQQDRERIIPRAEFDKAAKRMDERYFMLAQALESFNENDAMATGEALMDAVERYYKRGTTVEQALTGAGLIGMGPRERTMFVEFAEAIRAMPTEYFEAKPQRVVGLEEFAVAVVPEGTDRALIDALLAKGVGVEYYSLQGNDSAGNRQRAIAAAAASRNILFQAAFHGSPAIFERFAMQYMGSGEGAQAFGWGMYFAQDRTIAEWYRDTLSRRKGILGEGGDYRLDGKKWSELPAGMRDAAGSIYYFMSGGQSFAEAKASALESTQESIDSGEFSEEELQPARIAMQVLPSITEERFQFIPAKRAGMTYEVDVPEDDELLHYDRTLLEQSPAVIEKLIAAGILAPSAARQASHPAEVKALAAERDAGGATPERLAEIETRLGELLDESRELNAERFTLPNGEKVSARALTGHVLYQALAESRGSERDASLTLDAAGIPGLRFLDANSRTPGAEQQHNFVIWNEERIQMMRTYKQEGAAFRKWFKESKVVDAAGKPLVVYHGTHKSFDAFDPESIGDNFGADERGFFFTSSPKEASDYAENDTVGVNKREGANVMPVYLSLQKPLVITPAFLESEGMGGLLGPGGREDTISFWDNYQAVIFEWAEARGADGVIVEDPSFKEANGEPRRLYVAFKPAQVKSATGNRGTFSPRSADILKQEDNDVRGYLQIVRDGTRSLYRIALDKKADLSTFLHESAHMYLDIFEQLAGAADAPQRLKDDFAKVREFVGAEDGKPLTVEQHEKFARSWEAYLREGKSPSAALRRAFFRMKRWLTAIYAQAADLDVELNDEIRGVFDRMAASDKEIAATRRGDELMPRFATPEEAGMTGPEFEAYLASQERASEAVARRVHLRALKDALQEAQDWWKEEEEKLQDVVAAEYDALPAARVMADVRGGVKLGEGEIGGKPIVSDPHRMNAEDVERIAGPEVAAKLKSVTKRHGESPEALAQVNGFESAKEMLEAMAALPERETYVREEAARRMREAHPDLMQERASLEAEIREGLFGDTTADVLLRELKALHKRVGSTPLPAESYRQAAEEIVNRATVRGLSPARALQAERAAGRKATEASIRGNYPQALVHAQQQLLQFHLWRVLTEAKERQARFETLAKKLQTPRRRQVLGLSGRAFLDVADDILESLGLAPEAPQGEEPRLGMVELRQALESNEMDVAFDAEALIILMANPRDWRTLTVAEMDNVHDALAQIWRGASDRNKIADGDKRALLQDVADSIALEGSRLGKVWTLADDETLEADTSKWRGNRQAELAALMQPQRILERLGATAHRILWGGFLDAREKENQLADKVLRFFMEKWDALPKGMEKARRDVVPGALEALPLPPNLASRMGGPRSRQWMWMLALNFGNASNRERLLGGYGWREEQVQAFLDEHMTREEWEFVQGVWDLLDKELWPEMSRTYERINGIKPPKIAAVAIETKHGVFRGGYFPAKYRSDVSNLGQVQVDDALAALRRSTGKNQSISKSFTKERAKVFTDVVDLDFGVIPGHILQTIHYTAFEPYVRDAARLTHNQTFIATVQQRLGRGFDKQIAGWLSVVAAGQGTATAGDSGSIGRWASIAKNHFVVAALGFSIPVALGDLANPFVVMASGKIGMRDTMQSYFNALAGGARNALWDKTTRRAIRSVIGEAPQEEGFARMREHALSKSRELRNRAGQGKQRLKRQLSESADTRRGVGRALQQARDFTFIFMEWSDKLTSTIVWDAAYSKALRAGKTEAEAIALGDDAVSFGFPPGDVMEQPGILRDSTGVAKMLTFYGYWSSMTNQGLWVAQPGLDSLAEAEGMKETLAATFTRPEVASSALRFMLMMLMAGALGDLFSGRGPEEDDSWLEWAMRRMLFTPFNAVPFLGGLLESGARAAWGKARPLWNEAADGEWKWKPPSTRAAPIVDMATRTFKSLSEGLATEGMTPEKAGAIAQALGLIAGGPVSQPKRTLKYANDVLNTGAADPQDAGDVAAGLIYGQSEHFRSKNLNDLRHDVVNFFTGNN